MKIQYASDLHLEFSVNLKYAQRSFCQPIGNILLLAGDVIPLNKTKKAMSFLEMLSAQYEHVYWIPGNHEYYYGNISALYDPIESFDSKIFSNITLLNNKTIELDDCRIVFSSFWSHIPIEQQYDLKNGMHDFSLIKYNGNPISCEQYNLWHQTSINFIKNEVQKIYSKRTIVVTHHLPTFNNYPNEFRDSPISSGFATEYADFILDSTIDYWIFGHHHRNVLPFKIGETTLLTNQVGYVWHEENKGFDINSHINI